jgi:hypothetical protein
MPRIEPIPDDIRDEMENEFRRWAERTLGRLSPARASLDDCFSGDGFIILPPPRKPKSPSPQGK